MKPTLLHFFPFLVALLVFPLARPPRHPFEGTEARARSECNTISDERAPFDPAAVTDTHLRANDALFHNGVCADDGVI